VLLRQSATFLFRYALLASVFFVSTGAHAQVTFLTGRDLLGECANRGDRGSTAAGVCVGYTTAIADSLARGPVWSWRACLNEGISSTQIARVARLYMETHPQDLDYPAAQVVARALNEAFPCR